MYRLSTVKYPSLLLLLLMPANSTHTYTHKIHNTEHVFFPFYSQTVYHRTHRNHSRWTDGIMTSITMAYNQQSSLLCLKINNHCHVPMLQAMSHSFDKAGMKRQFWNWIDSLTVNNRSSCGLFVCLCGEESQNLRVYWSSTQQKNSLFRWLVRAISPPFPPENLQVSN